LEGDDCSEGDDSEGENLEGDQTEGDAFKVAPFDAYE